MKQERGRCSACGRKTVIRNGITGGDSRPQYLCLNGNCNNTYSKGHEGEEWDTKPAPTKQ